MTQCYKCRKNCNNVSSIDSQFKCGLCKDYEKNLFDNFNPFLSSQCDCRVTCLECEQKKCVRCGSVKRNEAINHCKNCEKVILERTDGIDTDYQGNWVDDIHGRIIGSCEECIDCGNKTVCRNCASDKATEKNNQQTIIKNQVQRIEE